MHQHFEFNEREYLQCGIYLIFFTLSYQWNFIFPKKIILNIVASIAGVLILSDHLSNYRVYIGLVIGTICGQVFRFVYKINTSTLPSDLTKWSLFSLYFIQPICLLFTHNLIIDHTDFYVGALTWTIILLAMIIIWDIIAKKYRNDPLLFYFRLPPICLAILSFLLGFINWLPIVLLLPVVLILSYFNFLIYLSKQKKHLKYFPTPSTLLED